MPEVSIIIPNWNGEQFLEKCLSSVFRQDFDDYEVIVVDNASSDSSVQLIKRRFPAVRLIQNPENYMFAKGCNIGVARAKGKYYALLNNDTVVDRKWLSELLKVLKSDKNIKGVGSLAYNRYGAKDYVFPGHGTSSFFFQNTLIEGIPRTIRTPVDFAGPGGGACLFENTGEIPFDDDYFMYGEDTYHAMKLRLRGFTHKMVPTSRFYHEGEGTSKKVWTKKIFFQERNRWLNFLIIYGPFTIVRLLPLAMVNIAATIAYDPGNCLTRFKSYAWLLAHPFKIISKRRDMQSNRKVRDKELLKYLSCKFYEEYLVPNKTLKSLVISLNKLQWFYCYLLGLRTVEMFKIVDGTIQKR